MQKRPPPTHVGSCDGDFVSNTWAWWVICQRLPEAGRRGGKKEGSWELGPGLLQSREWPGWKLLKQTENSQMVGGIANKHKF